tara:strand:+ start:1876 stop:2517 length:642 start_codon:yes stop_codon:yes gene_type:complete
MMSDLKDMNLVLLGAPGAGKGTQAKKIIKKYGLTHVSTGDIIRSEISSKSDLGKEVQEIVSNGNLVSDGLVFKLLKRKIETCKNGCLFDGFPRTTNQADMLNSEIEISKVLFIDVNDEVIIERITGRRLDPETGNIYHIQFNPPAEEIKSRLIQRKDDTYEVAQSRLDIYRRETEPLVAMYASKGMLTKIDGNGTPDEVEEKIANELLNGVRV